MSASALFSARAIVSCCILSVGSLVWCQPVAHNLPDPPPLPPSLKNKQFPLPPDLPDPSELQLQLKQLGELLNMEPDKLNKLRQTIELIEKMSPAEREAMRIRISQVTRSSPELSSEVQKLAEICPHVSQSDLSQFWLAASADERDSVRNQLEQLDEKQGAALIETKVTDFVKKRDTAFENMRKSLEMKRNNLLEGKEDGP